MNNSAMPLVSVIIPAFRAEHSIIKAIRSVQKQTMSNWEIIVVDDCSPDNTSEVVKELMQSDDRIHLYINEHNMGVAASRNRAIDASRGEYVAFLDSDDAWRPEKLEKQLEYMKSAKADLVYTAYAIVDHTGQRQYKDFHVPSQVSFEQLLKENVIGCSTVMLSAAIAKKNKFEEDFYHEDYVLWLNLLRSGCKAVGVEQVLVDYSFHEDSKAGNKQNSAVKRWNIYRRYLGFSVVKSGWYFAHYALAGLRKYASKK